MNCVYCESFNLKFIETIFSNINGKTYESIYCNDCGLRYFTPMKYEDVYQTGELGYDQFHEGRSWIPEWVKEIIKYLKDSGYDVCGKSILDVGCGDGAAYLALKESFGGDFEYLGLESDLKSVEACKKRGIDVKSIYLNEDSAADLGKFDLVLCTEVLEHQVDVKGFLNALNTVSKGLIIITIPNYGRNLRKWRSINDIPPHHFLRFDKTFFRKNFKNLIYSKVYNFKDKKLVDSCKVFSNRFWILFLPIVLALRVADYFNGEGLLVVLK